MLVDANVLLRHLTGVPADLAARATALLAGESDLRITDVTVAEVVWVLKKTYGASRPVVARSLRATLALPTVHAADPALLIDALVVFESSKVSWIDAYLAAIAVRDGSPIASFDRDFDSLEGVTRHTP